MVIRKSAEMQFTVALQLGVLIWKAEKALILANFTNIRTDFFRNKMWADYRLFGLSGEITITFRELEDGVLVDISSMGDPSNFVDVNTWMQRKFKKNLRLESN